MEYTLFLMTLFLIGLLIGVVLPMMTLISRFATVGYETSTDIV